MASVNFQLKILPDTKAVRAGYLSAIVPLVGHVKPYPGGIIPALRTVRKLWQMRAKALRDAHCEVFGSRAFVYALNCPPCAAYVIPESRPCRLSYCPFCFARRISTIAAKIHNYTRNNRCVVVTYRKHIGHCADQHIGIALDQDGGVSTSLSAVLQAEQRHARSLRKQYLQGSLGGYHWHTVAPDTDERYCTAHHSGRWLRSHSFVAVMPADWDGDIPDAYVLRTDYTHQLAGMIGNTFQYKRAWMFCAAAIMAEFVNTSKRTRFMNPFGCFKRGNTN